MKPTRSVEEGRFAINPQRAYQLSVPLSATKWGRGGAQGSRGNVFIRSIRSFTWLPLLAALIFGLLNSGCLVVSSNHVSKPVAPKETVERLHGEDGQLWDGYVDHVHSRELDIDVAVHNAVERFQVGFLFWVLPIPYSKSGSPDARVQVDVRPIGNDVIFDPWRILYIPAPGAPDAPVKISHLKNGEWKPIAREPLSIHQSESFMIDYDGPCNPDSQFTVSLASASGKIDLLPSIDYKCAKFFHTRFQLPY